MIGNNLFHTIIVDVDSTSPIGVGIIDPTGKINRIHHMVHINGVSPAETIIIVYLGLVVIKITPNGAREPYIDHAAASFKTEILAMS